MTYWYGLHRPCLRLSDSFHISDPADEEKHQYDSPTKSDVQTLSSRYPWGPDHDQTREIYPQTSDTGRYITGASTFRLRIDPANCGVLLRRKFDYGFAHQCARVSIAEDRPGAAWHNVGIWYTAGSNTVVYTNPKGELGATQHIVQASNRRWREDELLLPAELTSGLSFVRVRIEFMPRTIALFPGEPVGQQAWSEYRYWAYSYVMPRW